MRGVFDYEILSRSDSTMDCRGSCTLQEASAVGADGVCQSDTNQCDPPRKDMCDPGSMPLIDKVFGPRNDHISCARGALLHDGGVRSGVSRENVAKF